MSEVKDKKQQKDKTVKKKKAKLTNVSHGKCYVKNAFGNTMISMTDLKGNVLCWSSAGALGFKGSRKGTPFAAQTTAETVAKKAVDLGLKTIDVFQKGPGLGRETTVRSLMNSGLVIRSLRDITPVPHNGCRPPKRRRV